MERGKEKREETEEENDGSPVSVKSEAEEFAQAFDGRLRQLCTRNKTGDTLLNRPLHAGEKQTQTLKCYQSAPTKAGATTSPFPLMQCFSSPRMSLRSFTLDVVTFTANFFRVSET